MTRDVGTNSEAEATSGEERDTEWGVQNNEVELQGKRGVCGPC